MSEREYISYFKPVIKGLDSASVLELSSFYAGENHDSFTNYIKPHNDEPSDAMIDLENGIGVTHLIWNKKDNDESDLVGYFTIAVNVLPYDDRADEDEDDYNDDDISDLSKYPSISVAEIKMFAISDHYQDLFYVSDGVEMPVSAWCLNEIVNYCDVMSSKTIGFKALFLHSVPEAEQFYIHNFFRYIPHASKPLFSVDSDNKAMWLPIRPVLLQDNKVIQET